MGRQERRSSGSKQMGMQFMNMFLSQYGISPSVGRMAGAEFNRVIDVMKKHGLKPSEDMFLQFLAMVEAVNVFAPDKVKFLLPYLTGRKRIPDDLGKGYTSMLKGGIATMRAVSSIRNGRGQPILEIHRKFIDDSEDDVNSDGDAGGW